MESNIVLKIDAEIGYARGAVIQRVRLDVAPGDVILVRGANGVGKSTLLSTVAGNRPPLDGTVVVEGHRTDSTRAKRHIGYVTDPPNLFEELTPDEHLKLAISLWTAARIPIAGAEISSAILEGTPDISASMLSLGQRKRLGLALAVLHRPWLWLLDEPFNGLDEASSARVRQQIATHLGEGGAVLCATHDEGALGRRDARILELGRDSPILAKPALVQRD
ncbi:ATP-binding cassette domain-containing protein [Paeniglutamicibacter sp. NPDC091659]|uniref:ABC transporter ATP-binding protein n=1 Tax=Paeniglutamicibacter sp. NPDC091659 TaxID=3364389 RepID=UPI0038244FAE